MEENQQAFKTSVVQHYKHDFKKIYDFAKDIKNLPELWKGVASDLTIVKGSSSCEINTEFTYIYRGTAKCHLKIVAYEETDTYATASWASQIDSDENLPYMYTFYCYRVTLDNTCVLVAEITSKKKMSEEATLTMKRDIKFYMENLDRYVKSQAVKIVQYESIVIALDAKIVWSVVSNMKLLSKLVPLVCDSVEYPGDNLVIGSSVTLKWDTENSHMQVKFKVGSLLEENGNYTLSLNFVEAEPKVPPQTIEWKMVNIGNNSCYVTFVHQFEEQLKIELINSISSGKKQILKNLKKILEEKISL